MNTQQIPHSAPQSVKPIIALTPYHNIEKDEPYMRPAYLQAIIAAGGIPLILPLGLSPEDLTQLVPQFDGFLFCGGPDIHPSHFGENTHIHCGNVSVQRDSLEFTLLSLAMDAKKPILGICRGIQLLNVALGGDLYQDIPSQFSAGFPIAHTQPFGYEIPSHTVNLVPDTLLARICKSSDKICKPSGQVSVNSMHHQAIRLLAPGLFAAAHASDGLIEAVEMPDYPTFFLGIQWHPEYLWPRYPEAAGIFQSFITAAQDRKNGVT